MVQSLGLVGSCRSILKLHAPCVCIQGVLAVSRPEVSHLLQTLDFRVFPLAIVMGLFDSGGVCSMGTCFVCLVYGT